MTDTESSLLRAILESPGDDTPRLAMADWLDDNAGTVRCPICTGPGFSRGPVPTGCTKCRGGLEVPDGRRELAEFIRDCVLTLASHTDCPVRLADLKQGRPVPLRCGACNYCVARRRAEKYYARHQWVDGVPYAVAFEPTPLDGDMPTGPGLTLIVRRGFVAEVRAPLAVLAGEECYLCHAGLGDGHPPRNCPACSGTGRVGGIGRDLFGLQPVTRVDTDRLPSTQLINGRIRWAFWREHEPGYESLPNITPVSRVPWQLLEYLDAGYESESAARDALSAAMVAYFREQCGLTPLGIT